MKTQVTVTGNTYQVKEHLKSLGLSYNSANKSWSGLVDQEEFTRKTSATWSRRIFNNMSKCKVKYGKNNDINGLCPICHTYCQGDCRS